MSEPKWLGWVRLLESLAQTGLSYTQNPYDQQRYQQLLDLAAEMAASLSEADDELVRGLFAGNVGPGTPKVDVRGVVFKDDAVLMVRETSDSHRWTLPGGWADVNETPSEATVREIFEESGYRTRPVKLLALYDKTRQDQPPDFYYIYKVFFLCELTGGTAQGSLETSEVAFFKEDEIPQELSLGRVTHRQLKRFFEHHRQPDLPTDFD
ncbi:MAG: NUDIX hydrolase [bacterium]|nr:NUDIX hydrolase [bacterium]